MLTEMRIRRRTDGSYWKKPVIIKAAHLNCTSFEIQKSEHRWLGYENGSGGNLPSILILRAGLKNENKDPWKEVGSPPTVLTEIIVFDVDFLCGAISVCGLEYPNMMFGGRFREPYDGCTHLKSLKAQSWEPGEYEVPSDPGELRFQQIDFK